MGRCSDYHKSNRICSDIFTLQRVTQLRHINGSGSALDSPPQNTLLRWFVLYSSETILYLCTPEIKLELKFLDKINIIIYKKYI